MILFISTDLHPYNPLEGDNLGSLSQNSKQLQSYRLDVEKSFITNTLEAAVAERYYMCDKLFMTGEARVTNSWCGCR